MLNTHFRPRIFITFMPLSWTYYITLVAAFGLFAGFLVVD